MVTSRASQVAAEIPSAALTMAVRYASASRFAALLKLLGRRERRRLEAAYAVDPATGVRKLRSPLTGRRKAAVEVLLKERMPLATESGD